MLQISYSQTFVLYVTEKLLPINFSFVFEFYHEIVNHGFALIFSLNSNVEAYQFNHCIVKQNGSFFYVGNYVVLCIVNHARHSLIS